MSDYIHLNGQLVPYEGAGVAAGDAGLLHGAGLFETMRARGGKVFRMRQHLNRVALGG
jgi:branched-chain amino acid aminotransferase